MSASSTPDPLHGITLKAMLEALVAGYGWSGLGERIDLRCFTHEPSINSSLKFLRKTPWARKKVERLFLHLQRYPRSAERTDTRPAREAVSKSPSAPQPPSDVPAERPAEAPTADFREPNTDAPRPPSPWGRRSLDE
jgi:uncharacterized protein (DUF2132 family)